MARSKILIVDSNPVFVNLLSEELELYGQFEVLTATRENEEIAALKDQHIDITLVDIDAENIEGLHFLSFMSTTHPRTPCIVMTRQDQPETATINTCASNDSIFCYTKKPTRLIELGGEIIEGLSRIDENDYSPGIAVNRLLHLLAARKKTGRIQIKFGSKKHGFFDFHHGTLQDALCSERVGEEALAEMLSWPPVSFQLETLPADYRKNRIPSGFLNAGQSAPANATSSSSDKQKKIKVLIVDDSKMMRKVIANVFKGDDSIEIVGEADNGKTALELLPQLCPDVVTLDVQMPVMDGIKTLKHMMIQAPTPTIMLSAYTREGAVITYDALRFGAVDFVAKPSNVDGLDLKEQAREIVRKVHLAAAVELEAVKYIRAAKKKSDAAQQAGPGTCETLVTIGSAEGGYGALLKILPLLRPELSAAYLVMLHVSPQHVDSFIDYLGTYCAIPVKRAQNHAPIDNGVCYLASGEEYLIVQKKEQTLLQHLSPAPFASRRGAIDMLMFSVAEAMKKNTIGVILSGMGSDGVEGLEEIIRVGGSAVLQDSASCLYKEMVQNASQGCPAAPVVPDGEIAERIHRMISTEYNVVM